MCPRRQNVEKSNSKRQERETRQQEKKSREKKTHGKEDEEEKANKNQLRAFNLQLRNIIGDGNCLFRSFADQLEGNQHRHGYYRKQICDYMRSHREEFEPFIVDQPFDTFLRALDKDGTYGGNECLVAFSRLFDAKICIHQASQPVWTVCFSEPAKHEVHIFYHDYEHYSSVRRLGDHSSDSANIRQSMTTCDPSSVNEKPKTTTQVKPTGACAMDPPELFTEHDVDYILSQIPHPVDPQLVRDTLNDNQGDIDGTISSILALVIPSTPEPTTSPPPSIQPIEQIMNITGIDDVEFVQESFVKNNLDIDSTVESLTKLNTDDYEELSENEEPVTTTTTKTTNKNRPAPSRQVKADKKKAKKQRAMEKHRAQILEAAGKSSTKQSSEGKSDSAANPEQEPNLPVNMEFIRI